MSMKILFLDFSKWTYDTRTPLHKPLGGTQSAVAYLSAALAAASHEIAVLITDSAAEPAESEGVRFLTLPCSTETLNAFDVVVLSTSSLAQTVRDAGCTRPLVLWAQHDVQESSVQALKTASERDHYAGFAMVSEWQSEQYRAAFGIDGSRMRVLRNAASPAFLAQSRSVHWFQAGRPPVLAYTSTPFRGLDVLLMSFPAIRARLPGVELRVFSSMGIYHPDTPDPFSSLYELAKALPGVTYVGPLPQARLAEAMREVDVWSYPCIFPETSCISAIEAMASGTLMVTTTQGALPETTSGFAELVSFSSMSPAISATAYAKHLVQAVNAQSAEKSAERLEKQVAYARANYNWPGRAAEWVAWLDSLL
jgi:glycosyltransferase involved in cell wall biosynthesis